MTPFPARRAPWWFVLVVAVALGVVARMFLQVQGVADATPCSSKPTSLAFWFFLVAIAEAIWKGFEAAGRVTLEILAWSVKALWFFAQNVGNGLKALGSLVSSGVKRVWEFFAATYEKVLKPAWEKFWGWFDKFRRWLDDTVGPVLSWLRELRNNLIGFWQTYVRPWLDLIDVTRKLLRTLGSLGLDWARALDRRLATLEADIQKPFNYVLGKLNEVINVVNLIMTADGLFQRLTLIRSLERDYKYAGQAIVNPYKKGLSNDDKPGFEEARTLKTLDTVVSNTARYMRDGDGPSAPLIEEMAVIWRNYLVRR